MSGVLESCTSAQEMIAAEPDGKWSARLINHNSLLSGQALQGRWFIGIT
jgi:hypothetical protein